MTFFKISKSPDKKRDFKLEDAAVLIRMLEDLPTSIFVKDDQLRFVFSNISNQKYMRKTETEILGFTDADIFVGEQSKEFIKRDRALLETGKESIADELITRGDGTVTPVLTRKARYIAPDGKTYLIGTNTDLTEVKAKEEQYRILAETPKFSSADRAACRLYYWRAAPFECRARPFHANHRAMAGRRRIAGHERRPAALQQGLGDEQPEAEARAFFRFGAAPAATRRHIGIADAAQHVRRKARPVVFDGDADPVAGEPRPDVDLAHGKIQCVLNEVPEAIDKAGVAAASRLHAVALDQDVHRDRPPALRRDDLFDEVPERHAAERPLAVDAERCDLGEYGAAARGLLGEQGDILADRAAGRHEARQFLDHQRDRGERRAEFMRRRRREPVELR